MQDVRFALYLYSICNVLIVVQDTQMDIHFWKFIQLVEALKRKIPDPWLNQIPEVFPYSSFHVQSMNLFFGDKRVEFFPDLVYMINKAPSALFGKESYDTSSNLLKAFFKQNLRIMMPKTLSMFSFGEEEAFPVYLLPIEEPRRKVKKEHIEDGSSRPSSANQHANSASPFQHFLKPNQRSDQNQSNQDNNNHYNNHLTNYFNRPASFKMLVDYLRQRIFETPRRNPQTPISEKDWFRNSTRAWDAIKKSDRVKEYEKFLNETIFEEIT